MACRRSGRRRRHAGSFRMHAGADQGAVATMPSKLQGAAPCSWSQCDPCSLRARRRSIGKHLFDSNFVSLLSLAGPDLDSSANKRCSTGHNAGSELAGQPLVWRGRMRKAAHGGGGAARRASTLARHAWCVDRLRHGLRLGLFLETTLEVVVGLPLSRWGCRALAICCSSTRPLAAGTMVSNPVIEGVAGEGARGVLRPAPAAPARARRRSETACD
jgi:hypothetical protein